MRTLSGLLVIAAVAVSAAGAEFTEGRLTTEPGVEIHWRAAGTGPVVIVPGGFRFGSDLDRLAASHRLILYDLRNRGRSSPVEDPRLLTIEGDVRDLEAVRNHFQAGSFSAIGYAYLGKIIVLYALAHPRRIDRLIQIGPFPMQSGPAIPPIWDNSGEEGLDPELVAPTVGKAAITALELASLTAPVLTIHGTRDRNAPYGGGREWAAMLPDGRLRTVSGGGHQAWVDEPAVLGEMAEFLSGVWPAAAEEIDVAREVWLSQLRGVELLEKARRAHGAHSGPLPLRLEGTVYPRSQSKSPRPPYDPFPIELEVLFASGGKDVVVDEHFHWPGFVSRYRAVSTPEKEFEVDLNSGRMAGTPASRKVWLDQIVRVPPVLVDMVLIEPGSVRFLGAGEGHYWIAARAGDTRVTLALDRNHRLRRVTRLVSDELTGDALEVVELEGEQPIGDLVVPRAIRRLFNGRVAAELRVAKGTSPDLARFEIAPDWKRDAAAAMPLAVDRVAEDVLLVRNIGGADYKSLVVVHDDGLVLLETPRSEEAMDQVIARLKAELPGKPIKAVMVTHHHFDHSGGVRAAMRENAEIYVPRGGEALFREIATAPRTLERGSSQIDPSSLRIRGVESAVIEAKSEGPAVHIHAVGANEHADGILFASIPSRKIVFQGDLFVKLGEPAPARGQSIAFRERLRELGLAPERIIGVHGQVATIEDLDRAIRLRGP